MKPETKRKGISGRRGHVLAFAQGHEVGQAQGGLEQRCRTGADHRELSDLGADVGDGDIVHDHEALEMRA